MSPPRPALLARSRTLDAVDDALDRLKDLRAAFEAELMAQGAQIDIMRRCIIEAESARDGWKSRCEIAESALDAARRETPHDTEGPDPRPAMRALEEARAKEGT